ncbi:MAG: hypothetical protein J2P21_12645 [Chloracidobacterium sp.]|nr:hypothetical protein [Chloracidobacterium sp.]
MINEYETPDLQQEQRPQGMRAVARSSIMLLQQTCQRLRLKYPRSRARGLVLLSRRICQSSAGIRLPEDPLEHDLRRMNIQSVDFGFVERIGNGDLWVDGKWAK